MPRKPPPPQTSSRRRPGTYVITDCSRYCSLNKDKLPGQMAETIHSWYEAGLTNSAIQEKAAVAGIKLSNGAIGRHGAHHLAPADQVLDPTEVAQPAEKLSDLEILERMIQRGAQSLSTATFRVSPEQMLKALDMKYRLTQGSAFESFINAVAEAMGGDDEEDEDIRSSDERMDPPAEQSNA